jgi:hypothetical protein
MLFQTQFLPWVWFPLWSFNGNHTHRRNCVWNNIYGRNYTNRNDIHDIHDRNNTHGRKDNDWNDLPL